MICTPAQAGQEFNIILVNFLIIEGQLLKSNNDLNPTNQP